MKKKIYSIMLSLLLALACVTQSTTVYALEYSMPMPYDQTIFMTLFGLLGVAPSDGAIDSDTANDLTMDLYLFFPNDREILSSWWENIRNGVIDTTSVAWTKFKQWVNHLLSQSGTGGGSVSVGEQYNPPSGYSPTITINGSIASSPSINYHTASNVQNTYTGNYKCAYYTTNANYTNTSTVNFCICSTSSTGVFLNGNAISLTSATINGQTIYYYNTSTQVRIDRIDTGYNINVVSGGSTNAVYLKEISYILLYGTAVSTGTTSDYDYIIDDVTDIGLINGNSIAVEGDVSIPWGNVGEDEDEIDAVIGGIIAGVGEGELDVADLPDAITEVIDVIPVIPAENETTGEDELIVFPEGEPVEPIIEQNRENAAFVITGLERFFPFCIPWDIYAFVTIFEAEPLAPTFQWKFPDGDGGYITQTIDLSPFNSVAQVLRYGLDVLFIISLAMLSRNLIGGDD